MSTVHVIWSHVLIFTGVLLMTFALLIVRNAVLRLLTSLEKIKNTTL